MVLFRLLLIMLRLEEFLEIFARIGCGFAIRTGNDILFKVESRSVLEGLVIVWNIGFRPPELECDNALLVETPLIGGAVNSRMLKLYLIRYLLCHNWEVRIQHIPKDLNKVADLMAKIASLNYNNLQLFEEPPISIQDLLNDNLLLCPMSPVSVFFTL
ncbi:hypothetical protein J1N35_006145 [Gossypium stocksii]|uniref:RNase H type-1 domain-containing protein n=1 Tax=Gossypium stocksii TaxID=47602 RepID=A0A9D3WH43_9ROSI|nr:hypothetical protein J1N35_006145 [Gossypium stocksii]